MNEIKTTTPELNREIVKILRLMTNEGTGELDVRLYAAARIEELEGAIREILKVQYDTAGKHCLGCNVKEGVIHLGHCVYQKLKEVLP